MNRPILSLSLIMGLFLLPIIVCSQNFHVSSYTEDDGFENTTINGIVQDELGFVWITSDAGLIRFDGERFLKTSEKRFLGAIKRASGHIIVADEDSLWELHSLPEGPMFYPIEFSNAIKGDRPIQLYEDSKLRLWAVKGNNIIHEANGPAIVTELDNEKLLVSEDKQGVIWAFAEDGSVYRFNKLVNTFEVFDYKIPYPVFSVEPKPGAGFFIGSKGVLEFIPDPEQPSKSKASVLVDIPDRINFIVTTALGMFVGTQNHSLQMLIPTDARGFQLYPVEDHTFPHSTGYLTFSTANIPFVGYDYSLWVGTNEGFSHLKPNIFDAVDVVPKGFIDAIDQENDGDIYISQGGLFRIYMEDGKMKGEEVEVKGGATSSLAIKGDRIWLGTTHGEISIFDKKSKSNSKTVEIRHNKGQIFNIEADIDGSAWVCQAPNPEAFVGIARVYPDLRVKYYGEADGFRSRVLASRIGKDGVLYFGGTGDKHYLYRYNRKKDRVESLSTPLPFKHNKNFEVHDLHADVKGDVWLATTDGLLKYTEGRIERVNLGEYTHDEMRAIDLLDDGTLWASTATHGVIKYTTRGYTSFSEHNGLTTNISNYRSLLIDSKGMVWVGTAEGLELSQSANPSASPTLSPMITGIQLPNQRINSHESHNYQIPSNTYFTIEFLTLVFSTEEMLYQTRITELGMAWSEPSKNQELSIPSLSPGEYTFEIRSKEKSGHKWSKPSVYYLEVYTVWYMTNVAYVCYLILGVALVFLIVRLNTYRLKQYSRKLEAIILERTTELEHQKEEIAAQKEELATNNEQLIDLNNEKNYYISVVAHDLKSPLNRIASLVDIVRLEAKELPESTQKYLNMVKSSVSEQKRLITDILDLQSIETHQVNIHLESVDILELVKELAEEAKVSALEKSIHIHLAHPEEDALYIQADPHYLRQIAENLLSNAIKFSPHGKSIYIELRHNKNRVKYLVRDEGPGISVEDQQMLFRKFQKLSARPTAGEASSGLGLNIVKRFAEAMGARVWCKSKLGEGATFIVEFDEMPKNEVSPKNKNVVEAGN